MAVADDTGMSAEISGRGFMMGSGLGFLAAEFHGLGDAQGKEDRPHQCGADDSDGAGQNPGRQQIDEQSYAERSGNCLAGFPSCEGLDVIERASDAEFNRCGG